MDDVFKNQDKKNPPDCSGGFTLRYIVYSKKFLTFLKKLFSCELGLGLNDSEA
ncbi:hypothetical protein EV201_1734 [Ancylomarina subtilis]|uniref:Uncharacterized protein n=1 Tax=Ancylomarina subtilis TaxID=1639035 RepID=A0A4Q7VLT2_9BACT|nr:hypothetical protein EV201_1734 [Ancylomarina subtilis]